MRTRRVIAITAAAAAVVVPAGSATAAANSQPGSGATAAATGTGSFANFSVAETPGVTCPGATNCSNYAAEPAIRADSAGNFYGTSENGLGGGTLAVKSSDGGRHYTTLTSPDAGSSANTTGFSPGGGDTDLATAPVRNANGYYNVYAASLSLANVDVSTSSDGGKTWSFNPTSATIPGDDREWIAADGANKVCISYHDIVTSNIDVDCSYNAGATFTQLGDAIDTSHAYLIDNNEIGNLAVDPGSHTIYQVFSGVANAAESVTSTVGGAGYHAVWVGVSTDGGKTFTDHPVYVNPNTSVSYGHQFVNISLDKAGNLYAVFSDDHNLYYSYSTTHGQTWSKPVRVNSGSSATAIMPWSVAGDAGKLNVVWYGTSYYDGKNTPDNYPASAKWYVYFAQNLNATSGGGFTQTVASPLVHSGGVCESGVTCTGNRDLYDDFGVAASPVTGMASILYSDDQYNPNGPNFSGCNAAANNSSSCDHTAVATQTSGSGIFSTTTAARTASAAKGHRVNSKPRTKKR